MLPWRCRGGRAAVLASAADAGGRPGAGAWRRLAEAVANVVHVLTVDLPGHGENAAVPWMPVLDVSTAVADLVVARGHGRGAHLAGLSLGGYVATDLAADRPDPVPSALVSGVDVLPSPRPRLMRAGGRPWPRS